MENSEKTLQESAGALSGGKKLHTIKYIIAIVSWGVAFIGAIVDYFKSNPFPKKSEYETEG